MKCLLLILVSAGVLLFSGNLFSQIVGGQWEMLYQIDGVEYNGLGYSVSGAGDVDGDGHADLFIGSGSRDPYRDGSIEVRSGATGSRFWKINSSLLGAYISCAGDVNGDGIEDVVAGAPKTWSSAGRVYVYSGISGSIIWQFQGLVSGDRLGPVSGAGDVNGDGFADLIAGASQADPGGLANAGSAYVYSGATGSILWQFDGSSAGNLHGKSVSDAGDVDGDGYSDLIVGAPNNDPGGIQNAGSAYVYSGFNGNLIWRLDGPNANSQFGSSVSGAGDVDGDGFPDVIVGAYWADPGGRSDAGSAFVYSGATGGLIWQIHGTAPGDYLGHAVSEAGDINRDGFSDVLVGAYGADSAGVISGATGKLIWQFDGQSSADWFGYSVSGAGDVNADSIPDLIFGAHKASPGGQTDAGSAYVYSGATGTLIWQFDGDVLDHLGSSVSGAGDVDGDHYDDFIIGAYGADPGGRSGAGSAYVYSGATGALILQFDGEKAGDSFGCSVSSAEDVNGDGLPDLIVGAPNADPGGLIFAGSAYIYSGATGLLIGQFDGEAKYDNLGWTVCGAKDINGDQLTDLIVGAFRVDLGSKMDAGSAYVWSLDPFLHMDGQELSATAGPPIILGMDFPSSEAQTQYAIVSCASGYGPKTIGGIDVPLTDDNMLRRMLAGWSPSNMSGAFGVLNINGDARATIKSDPILVPHIGKTYYLAAITYDGITQTARLSSIARTIKIVP